MVAQKGQTGIVSVTAGPEFHSFTTKKHKKRNTSKIDFAPL